MTDTTTAAPLDPANLTMGEIARVEDLSGQPFTGLGDENRPKGKLLAALAFVAKKRTAPAFTWNDALALTLEEVGELVALDDDEDEGNEPEGDEPEGDAGNE